MEQEIALIAEIHDTLEQRVKRYMETIYHLKDDQEGNYFTYYMEMCNFFKQYDHDSTFCQQCRLLETRGRNGLQEIKRYYCKTEI